MGEIDKQHCKGRRIRGQTRKVAPGPDCLIARFYRRVRASANLTAEPAAEHATYTGCRRRQRACIADYETLTRSPFSWPSERASERSMVKDHRFVRKAPISWHYRNKIPQPGKIRYRALPRLSGRPPVAERPKNRLSATQVIVEATSRCGMCVCIKGSVCVCFNGGRSSDDGCRCAASLGMLVKAALD